MFYSHLTKCWNNHSIQSSSVRLCESERTWSTPCISESHSTCWAAFHYVAQKNTLYCFDKMDAVHRVQKTTQRNLITVLEGTLPASVPFLIQWCKGFSLPCAQNNKASFHSNTKVLLMQSATWRLEVKTPWPSSASLQCWGGKRVQSVRECVVTHSLVETLRFKQAELSCNR